MSMFEIPIHIIKKCHVHRVDVYESGNLEESNPFEFIDMKVNDAVKEITVDGKLYKVTEYECTQCPETFVEMEEVADKKELTNDKLRDKKIGEILDGKKKESTE